MSKSMLFPNVRLATGDVATSVMVGSASDATWLEVYVKDAGQLFISDGPPPTKLVTSVFRYFALRTRRFAGTGGLGSGKFHRIEPKRKKDKQEVHGRISEFFDHILLCLQKERGTSPAVAFEETPFLLRWESRWVQAIVLRLEDQEMNRIIWKHIGGK